MKTKTAIVDMFAARRVRHGKTAKDKASGATARRYANQATRRAWQDDIKSTVATFPFHVCNGKKNRSLVTTGVTESGQCIQTYVGASTWMNRKVRTA